MRLGSLYHVLHGLDSGKYNNTSLTKNTVYVSYNVQCGSVAEVKINISEGVKFAQDICNGMTYLHSMETLITRFDLSPHHVFVSLGGGCTKDSALFQLPSLHQLSFILPCYTSMYACRLAIHMQCNVYAYDVL